jgi:hypothetical protein
MTIRIQHLIGKQFLGPVGVASAAAACLCVSGIAQAQPGATPPGSVPPYSPPPSSPPSGPGAAPYYGPNYGPAQPPLPPQPAEQTRQGWNLGLSLGVGSMTSSAGDFECLDCDTEPPAIAFDLHVGTMIMPRMALQAEAWVQSRALDAYGDSSIGQSMFLLALQYWLTPRFWIKGGLGFASLTVSYNNGFEDVTDNVNDGSAVMGALGYELVSSSSFALDLQLKTGAGIYDDGADGEDISSGVLAVGVNWY